MSRAIRFVTSGPPAPGIGGDRIRMFHLIRQLARRGWDVRVWSLVTADEPDGFANVLQAECTEIVLAPRDVTTTQRLARFIFNTAIRRSYQRDWFTSPSTVRSAADWLSDAEAEPIVVQQLFMLPFVPLRLRRNVLLDTHNLEATRARSIADGDGQRLRRLAARAQVGPVARHERCAVRSVALSLAVSADERDAFELMAPGRVRLVPNGVDSRATVPATPTTSSSGLLFLGSLSYSPNVDAIRYFSDEISPLLLDSRAQLSVVGSSPSQAVRVRPST